MTEATAAVARRIWGAAGYLLLVAIRENLRTSARPARTPVRPMPATAPRAVWATAPTTAEEASHTRARFATHAPLMGLCVVIGAAIASRLRYIASFDGTYGSGDAHGILERALYIRDGNLSPSPQLVLTSDVFDQPALLPATLALLSQLPGVSLHIAPLILMPLLTIAAVVVLYRLLARTLGVPIAVGASLMFALLPRWSFDSTEPDKAPAVMSLFIFALAATEAGNRDRRFLVLGGFFMALSMLVHTTAYLFVPVLVGSYLAWHARDIKQAMNRHAAASLAFPVAAVVVYFVLARVFASAPLEGTAAAPESGVLPSFVQTYVDAAWNLMSGGFSDSAWSLYTNGIRNQVGTPVFVLALGGLAVAAYQILAERRWHVTPFVLWAAFITLAFAMQYPAASHGSRYPSYVTPVYIILAAYFVWNLAGLAFVWRSQLTAVAGSVALGVICGYTSISYTVASDPGLRDLYASHDKAADYIASEGLLDDGSGMLYMGWPSITFSLLESRPEYEDQLYTFGFGSRPLEDFDPAFLGEHGIKYYLLDHTGRDSHESSETVYEQLSGAFVPQELATFHGRPGSYSTLFLLRPRAVLSQSDVRSLFEGAQSTATQTLPLRNGLLCGVGDGGVPGWQANGVVALEPVGGEGNTCGVLVSNQKEWGGIRQLIPNAASARPFTAIAAVQSAERTAARTAVVAVFTGGRRIGAQEVVLRAGANYVAIEAFTPPDGESVRLVVSTGPGDEGDMIVLGAAVIDGFARDPAGD